MKLSGSPSSSITRKTGKKGSGPLLEGVQDLQGRIVAGVDDDDDEDDHES